MSKLSTDVLLPIVLLCLSNFGLTLGKYSPILIYPYLQLSNQKFYDGFWATYAYG